jgi:8-oxo-dGTP pyrophosphatase MutT (NUDIX family)
MPETLIRQPTIADVRRALTRPLPGLAAQLRMSPAYRIAELRDRTPPPAPKEAGVLILLYPHHGQLYLPLTRRTDTVENHKGQISLPGGARETGEALQETALRETCEELRAYAEDWAILGSLTPLYIPLSGFLITPFVAYTPTRPTFDPDPAEVAELIETPLALLLDPTTVVREKWEIRGAPVEVPFFRIYSHTRPAHGVSKVWGATAMVLSELVTLLREAMS